MSIPTDEQLMDPTWDGTLTAEDTKPVDLNEVRAHQQAQGDLTDVRSWARANGFRVSDRGRVSQEVKDAFEKAGGRPEGRHYARSSSSGGRRNQPPTPQEIAEQRRERIQEYIKQIQQDVQPFVLDIGCMFSGIEKSECLVVQNDNIYYTPKGQQLIFNGTQVRLFATTAARLQETERGQQIVDTFNSAAPWLFLLLSAGSIMMWFLNIMMMRQAEMMKKRMEMGFQPGNEGGGMDMRSMLGSFIGRRNKPKEENSNGNEPAPSAPPDHTAGVENADAEPLIATDGLK